MAAAATYSFLVQPGRVRVRAAREWEARGAGRGEAQEPLQPRARLVCVPREVERARGGGGDYFAASFGSRRRRVSSRRRRRQ